MEIEFRTLSLVLLETRKRTGRIISLVITQGSKLVINMKAFMTILILAPSIEKRVHSFHYFLNLVGGATRPQGVVSVVSEGSEERKYMFYEAEDMREKLYHNKTCF